ncbi:response regulator transcription factor [Phenylobacterium sp.]|uniref:response regulator transcription factor n=1 Tax=Phenylobacterium sp. TaxID=1871053 RepID=UPI0027360908|nr:response regulator [Phenylobacterium sp.]MDP3853102.1 response regulator [Phenylobacterium sp.]
MQGSPNAARYRILVVEDEPMVLELITTRLGLAGYQTFYGRDGYEALARINDVRPNAMILDINMPRLDGFDVLRHMKVSGQLARVPVMVLTARNQADDVQTAIKLGARDFLAKPFNDDQLLARVARLIRRPAARPAPPPPPGPSVIGL